MHPNPDAHHSPNIPTTTSLMMWQLVGYMGSRVYESPYYRRAAPLHSTTFFASFIRGRSSSKGLSGWRCTRSDREEPGFRSWGFLWLLPKTLSPNALLCLATGKDMKTAMSRLPYDRAYGFGYLEGRGYLASVLFTPISHRLGPLQLSALGLQ